MSSNCNRGDQASRDDLGQYPVKFETEAYILAAEVHQGAALDAQDLTFLDRPGPPPSQRVVPPARTG